VLFQADSPDKRPAIHVFKKFLSMSQHFMLDGYLQLSNLVNQKIKESAKLEVPFKTLWGPKDLQEAIDEVREAVEVGISGDDAKQEAFIAFVEKVTLFLSRCCFNSTFSSVCVPISRRFKPDDIL
jgi:hypothetical protein